MNLNVLGSVLIPLGDGRTADEHMPICAVMDDRFKKWLSSYNGLHAVQECDVGCETLVPAETWIQSYQENSHPVMLAEHSHERALYWLPADMFVARKTRG